MRLTSQNRRGQRRQKMHLRLGRSVRAVLSFFPPGRAWPVGAKVSPNGKLQSGRNGNFRILVIDRYALDPPSSAGWVFGDLSTRSFPTEAITSLVYVLVVHPPFVLRWTRLWRHEARPRLLRQAAAPLVRYYMASSNSAGAVALGPKSLRSYDKVATKRKKCDRWNERWSLITNNDKDRFFFTSPHTSN